MDVETSIECSVAMEITVGWLRQATPYAALGL
jgi:hypothetical protein